MIDIRSHHISFIKKHIPLSDEEIMRCIKKSSCLEFKEGMLFVGNEEFIFFFCIDENLRNTKAFKSFYKRCYPFMKNKYFYTKNLHNYADRCMLALNQDSLNPAFKKYIWL